MKKPVESTTLDRTQVAALLGCSPDQLGRLTLRGGFPAASKQGEDEPRWSRHAVELFLRSGCGRRAILC